MKKYKPACPEEAEFLQNYDAGKYVNPAVAVDLAVYAYDRLDNCLKLLLVRRGGWPYKGYLCLPGGFIEPGETLEQAATRELAEETGATGVIPDLVCVLSDPDRDPRQRVISLEYVALADCAALRIQAGDDAAAAGWFTVGHFSVVEQEAGRFLYEMRLKGARETLEFSASADAHACGWRQHTTGGLGFDHAESVLKTFLHLRRLIDTTEIVRDVLGEAADVHGVRQAAFL